MRSSIYYKNLMNAVIEKSEADTWEEAVKEWDVDNSVFREDPDCNTTCTCGKQGLRYLYTIRNLKNNNEIFPIGSTCIKEFNREELVYKASILESMYLLYRALKTFITVELDRRYFSRKLIDALYDQGAFVANKYNKYDAYSDYIFIKDMFNRKGYMHRNGPSEAQKRKIYCIIKYQIKSFLYNKFDNDFDINLFSISEEEDKILREAYGLSSYKPLEKKHKRGLKVDFGYVNEHGDFLSINNHDEDNNNNDNEEYTDTLLKEYRSKDKGNTLISLLLSIDETNSSVDVNTDNDSFPDDFRYKRIHLNDLLCKLILNVDFEELSDKIVKSISVELKHLEDNESISYIELSIILDN